MKAKSFLESAGIAALYALPIANAFLKSWHVDSFHHPLPVASIPRAILLLTLLVWALAWLVLVAWIGCRHVAASSLESPSPPS